MAGDSVPQHRHSPRLARHHTASNIRGTNQDLTKMNFIHGVVIPFYLSDIVGKLRYKALYHLKYKHFS